MIRILIADDSAVVRSMLSNVLSNDKRFEIVGMAENGKNAVEQCRQVSPDIVVMDINMPIMNGIEAIARIQEFSNAAIVAFTTEDAADVGYRCIEAGAIDIIQKPNLATMNRQIIENFCDKLYIMAEAYRTNGPDNSKLRKILYGKSITEELLTKSSPAENINKTSSFSIVAIGASTGGPAAIQYLLKNIGTDFPVPIVITQHIDKMFDTQFINWLRETTGCKVVTAENGKELRPGFVYIAPAGYHLCFKRNSNRKIETVLEDSEEIHFLKPAIDKMFKSCAQVTGGKTLAVLLTGMGSDGAEGLLDIYKAGGFTIAQSEKTCVIFGMPKAAIELNAVKKVEDLQKIPITIRSMAGQL